MEEVSNCIGRCKMKRIHFSNPLYFYIYKKNNIINKILYIEILNKIILIFNKFFIKKNSQILF